MRVNNINPGSLAGSDNLKTMDWPRNGAPKSGDNKIALNRDSESGSTPVTQKELAQAVDQLNKTMRAYNTELHFEVHEKSGELMVKVMNKDDDTVIREIPPEKILDMVAYIKETLGIIVDKLI